jgi:small subunit ribosomal protein S13
MPRISGTDIPEIKRIDIALTSIYGIGRSNVTSVLSMAKIEPGKKVKELSEEEINRIQKAIDAAHKVEGDLRKEIQENITRLRQTGTYRGKRHTAGLPVRGQRTRSNARTKRGKRMTIGALKKDDLLKKEKAETEKTKA